MKNIDILSPAFFNVATVRYKAYILFCIIWNYSWALYRANFLESGYFLEGGYKFWGILSDQPSEKYTTR